MIEEEDVTSGLEDAEVKTLLIETLMVTEIAEMLDPGDPTLT